MSTRKAPEKAEIAYSTSIKPGNTLGQGAMASVAYKPKYVLIPATPSTITCGLDWEWNGALDNAKEVNN